MSNIDQNNYKHDQNENTIPNENNYIKTPKPPLFPLIYPLHRRNFTISRNKNQVMTVGSGKFKRKTRKQRRRKSRKN